MTIHQTYENGIQTEISQKHNFHKNCINISCILNNVQVVALKRHTQKRYGELEIQLHALAALCLGERTSSNY
jgi:hypothetical protein